MKNVMNDHIWLQLESLLLLGVRDKLEFIYYFKIGLKIVENS